MFCEAQEAPFFRSWGGSWDTEYGRFFLGWYSGELLAHGERLMAVAAAIFKRNWPVRRICQMPCKMKHSGSLCTVNVGPLPTSCTVRMQSHGTAAHLSSHRGQA